MKALTLMMMVSCLTAYGQQDTIAVLSKQSSDRNVMLDASASEKPRDIPIGLPVASTWSPLYPYVHWAGKSCYRSIGLMGIEETVLRSGIFGFAVDSYTAVGGDELHGALSAMTNNDGLIYIDANAYLSVLYGTFAHHGSDSRGRSTETAGSFIRPLTFGLSATYKF